MLNWIMQNLATILISLALLIVVVLIVMRLIRKKKQGEPFCGCGCANCAMRGRCHKR